MIKRFCDICGQKLYSSKKYTSDLRMRLYKGTKTEDDDDIKLKEICESCFYKISDFLDEMRKEAREDKDND